ncbi:MAG: GNAT family N-acetyltransferase [Lactobacillus sp.]|jgi:putative acetyltransferase|nr:GNAT family N-acetyltransferase [Lactobacillus sp.]MCH3906321.1 GNAT family N-acetyltransferase [Lactobacillus sp.]MCH3990105.1 GNAT family N-acetyltransferase [Lactobacillus sp.]MCH4069181.1 GNAT family N-acetyltransferase [Lactobacillus sp.]MCI1303483.1 GNAT family N-acetyltransferase [Lactobacillus sp.]
MQIQEINDRSPEVIAALVKIWRRSVDATHDFLTKSEIDQIAGYVPQALKSVETLVGAQENGNFVGFMGIQAGFLEMLFIDPAFRGQGLGKQLLQLGEQEYGVKELSVNEQNPQAVGFYQHMGFETYKRTDHDEEGQPYPLLYMKLKG